MSAVNIAIAHRWFHEIWNERRLDVVNEVLTDTSVCHGESGPLVGPAGFLDHVYHPFTAAFPDIKVEVEDVIGTGDNVVIRWTAAGTHTGDGLGFPPTGKAVSFRGMTWLRAEDGKLIEGWQSSNIPVVLAGLAAA
jgi:steroid delta-isomerase-like uncharacterized protein